MTWDAALLGAGLAAGLTGGFLAGALGMGGGVLLAPLLRLLAHLDQHRAQGATLVALLAPTCLPALVTFRRRGIRLPGPVLGALVTGFPLGVWVGAKLACRLPEPPLKDLFLAFLVLLAAWTWWAARRGCPAEARGAVVGEPSLACCMVVAALGGLGSGLFGVGGGVILLPLLAFWLGLGQHQAQLATLVVMVLPTRLPGALVYLKACAPLPWLVLVGLAAGFTLGSYAGARVAVVLPGPRLRGACAGMLLGTALLMLWGAP